MESLLRLLPVRGVYGDKRAEVIPNFSSALVEVTAPAAGLRILRSAQPDSSRPERSPRTVEAQVWVEEQLLSWYVDVCCGEDLVLCPCEHLFAHGLRAPLAYRPMSLYLRSSRERQSLSRRQPDASSLM